MALTGACLAASPSFSLDELKSPCPKELDGQVSVAVYRFEFKSWSWKHKDGFVFCDCVRNNSPDRALFVDWKAAGLTGFVAPGRDIFTTKPYADDRSVNRPSQLFYGALPHATTVNTHVHAGPDRSASSSGMRFASWGGAGVPRKTLASEAYGEGREGGGVQTSSARLYLPSSLPSELMGDPGGGRFDAAKVIDYVESHPQRLRSFSMEFNSRTTSLGPGRVRIDYECDYSGVTSIPSMTSGHDASLAKFLFFRDPALQLAMFRTLEPVPFGGPGRSSLIGRRPDGGPFASGRVNNVAAGAVTNRSSTLEVLLGDRKTVIASMPINYQAASEAP